MDNIQNAINEFEKYNQINMNNYASDEYINAWRMRD